MDKSLLGNDVVVELNADGTATIYHSAKASEAVRKAVRAMLPEFDLNFISRDKLYCHNCFKFTCDTDEQLKAHEATCLRG